MFIYSIYPRRHHGWRREGKFWNLDPPDYLKITFPGRNGSIFQGKLTLKWCIFANFLTLYYCTKFIPIDKKSICSVLKHVHSVLKKTHEETLPPTITPPRPVTRAVSLKRGAHQDLPDSGSLGSHHGWGQKRLNLAHAETLGMAPFRR